MTTNFAEVLSKRPADIPPPFLAPVGDYLCVITGQYTTGESNQKKTPFVSFPAKIVRPMENVDPTELANIVGGVEGKELKGRLSTTFYLTDESMFMLDQFLTETLGLNAGDKTLAERLSEAPGHQFIMTVRQNASQDGKRLIAEVAGYSAV